MASILATAGLAYVSHYNYPGGKAMEVLHEVHRELVGADVAGNQTSKLALQFHQPPLTASQYACSCRPGRE